jgi:transposase
LIPKRKPRPRGGRPLITDTMVLAGILFVLKSGVLWEMLPQKM